MKKIKSISRALENCNKCNFPKINCICNDIGKLETEAEFLLLTHEKEILRRTNTGKYINKIFEKNTKIITWNRKETSSEFLDYINKNRERIVLVFPVKDDNSNKISKKEINKIENPIFIIIDGIWKEANKIYSKSEYLKGLKYLELNLDKKTDYDLRKAKVENSLSTFEVAVELLNIIDGEENVKKCNKFFDIYLKKYKASKSGHKLEIE